MADLKVWKRRELKRMRDDLDRLFVEFCQEFGSPHFFDLSSDSPYLELDEEEDGFVVRVELPGFVPDDLDVSASSDQVILRGSLDQQRFEEGERLTGTRSFSSRLRLPCKVDPDRVKALWRDEVLEIFLPRSRPSGFRKVRIEGGG